MVDKLRVVAPYNLLKSRVGNAFLPTFGAQDSADKLRVARLTPSNASHLKAHAGKG